MSFVEWCVLMMRFKLKQTCSVSSNTLLALEGILSRSWREI